MWALWQGHRWMNSKRSSFSPRGALWASWSVMDRDPFPSRSDPGCSCSVTRRVCGGRWHTLLTLVLCLCWDWTQSDGFSSGCGFRFLIHWRGLRSRWLQPVWRNGERSSASWEDAFLGKVEALGHCSGYWGGEGRSNVWFQRLCETCG